MQVHSGITTSETELLGAFARSRIAVIPRMTKMVTACRTYMAFAGFFSDDAVGTKRKALKLDRSESILSHHTAEDAGESNEKLSHVFPMIIMAHANTIAGT
jgi:hypothetical protein